MKKALITGITGQDGSYLADMLLQLGYEVHGIIRRSSSFHTERIDHIFDRLNLHYGDLTDSGAISHIIARVKPDEIYNLGAQSHVMVSFEQPVYTTDTIVSGTMNVLEAVRHNRTTDWEPKIYQASSSEMYGSIQGPQSEETPFEPQSPYAVCLFAQAFCLITKVLAGGRRL
jgi:GDPmannose 4,6-dehydratase